MNNVLLVLSGLVSGIVLSGLIILIKRIFFKKKKSEVKEVEPVKPSQLDIPLNGWDSASLTDLEKNEMELKKKEIAEMNFKEIKPKKEFKEFGWAVLGEEAFKVECQNEKFFGKRVLIEKK